MARFQMNYRTVELLAQNTRSVITFVNEPPPSFRLHNSPSLEKFIGNLVIRSRISVATILSTLVYLRRLQKIEKPMMEQLPSAFHGIFAGLLLLADKVINDCSMKNRVWSECSYQRDTSAGPSCLVDCLARS